MSQHEPTQEVLRTLLDYDPETGVFTWRPRLDASFNTRWAGTVAGVINPRGYRVIRVQYRLIGAHRLAWIHSNGGIPSGMVIDHINGDPSDNRLSNLRLATDSQNKANIGPRADSVSGIKGVRQNAKTGKWLASIRRDGKHTHLGSYGSMEQAKAAVDAALASTWGEFTRTNMATNAVRDDR